MPPGTERDGASPEECGPRQVRAKGPGGGGAQTKTAPRTREEPSDSVDPEVRIQPGTNSVSLDADEGI